MQPAVDFPDRQQSGPDRFPRVRPCNTWLESLPQEKVTLVDAPMRVGVVATERPELVCDPPRLLPELAPGGGTGRFTEFDPSPGDLEEMKPRDRVTVLYEHDVTVVGEWHDAGERGGAEEREPEGPFSRPTPAELLDLEPAEPVGTPCGDPCRPTRHGAPPTLVA